MRKIDNPLSASLLRALCILIEEGNVTNAARRLRLSQPATSLILKRMREIFGDVVFIRKKVTKLWVVAKKSPNFHLDNSRSLVIDS